jgi:hypothetical protein
MIPLPCHLSLTPLNFRRYYRDMEKYKMSRKQPETSSDTGDSDTSSSDDDDGDEE